LARRRPGRRAGKGLLTEAGLKSPIFYSEDFAIDGAAMLEKLSAMQMEGIVSKNVEAPYRSARDESWLKIRCGQRAKFPIVGFVKDPAGVATLHTRQAGGEGLRLFQVDAGFNRQSSVEIRKKLDAIVSSKPLW
jgi:bifunctional non-homologous end joining protein LigD